MADLSGVPPGHVPPPRKIKIQANRSLLALKLFRFALASRSRSQVAALVQASCLPSISLTEIDSFGTK
ncbi:hypothetical protein KFK09_012911 [Dendrobium nobile]|uniref:Uncharacterized protein n=1 Tax=Dendrobium nobile TaxID=94219 RepID=A0A8T3BGS8_DENNO|nr:hypothetical protein KFK09_012911 [Dendrobium nobile]